MLELIDNRLHNICYDTYPCIVHAQGLCETRLWNRLIEIVEDFLIISSSGLEDLDIITYNSVFVRSDGWNYPLKQLGRAEMSMDRFGLDYTILGVGIRGWKNKYKLLLALDFLRKSKKKYILSMDSSDVLVLGDVGRVLEYFRGRGCKMLFNAEACSFDRAGPIACRWREYQESLYCGPFCYLNAGARKTGRFSHDEHFPFESRKDRIEVMFVLVGVALEHFVPFFVGHVI